MRSSRRLSDSRKSIHLRAVMRIAIAIDADRYDDSSGRVRLADRWTSH